MEPEIHTWWPRLTIGAKHALRERSGEVIPTEVRTEIEQITGAAVRDGQRLTDDEVRYIETQREQVD